jgi:hypothetical protein
MNCINFQGQHPKKEEKRIGGEIGSRVRLRFAFTRRNAGLAGYNHAESI